MNVNPESNLSYAHVIRRLMHELNDHEWYYASYDYNGHPIKTEHYTLMAGMLGPNKIPIRLKDTINNAKPNIIILTEDMQKLLWTTKVHGLPIVHWMPVDNEDDRHGIAFDYVNYQSLIVSPTKFAEKIIRRHGITPIEQIYYPVDMSLYHRDTKLRAKTRRSMNIADDEIVLGFVGRPNWRKRMILLVEIFDRIHKKYPKTRLLLHTDINDPSYGGDMRELLYSKGLLDDKTLIIPKGMAYEKGFPPNILNGIYNSIDIYITSHGGEGMGLPIVEAMACGVPFVATDITTTKEFAGYTDKTLRGTRGCAAKIGMTIMDKNIKRPYVDIDHFVEQVEWLITHPVERAQMGDAGISFVKQEIESSVVGKKWQDLIKKITYGNEYHA